MKRGLIIALALFLAVPAMSLALAATERGSRWLLDMASAAAGDRVRYEAVEGTLLSGLRFSALQLRAGSHRARVGDARFRWRPRALLQGEVHVQALSLANIDYEAAEGLPPPPRETAPPESISLPVAIRVDNARVDDMVIRRAGGDARRVDHIVVQGFSADGGIVSLDLLDVRADALEITARGRVDPAPPHVVEGEVSWSLRLPDGIVAEGAGSFSGNLQTIRIDHRLSRPFSANVAGAVSPLAGPLRLDLSGDWRGLRWPLTDTPEISSPSGTFNLRGSLRRLALDLDAALDSDTVPLRHVTLEAGLQNPGRNFASDLQWRARLSDGNEATGRATLTGEGDRIAIDHVLEEPIRLTTRGHVHFTAQAPELSLDGEWRDLVWPLSGEPVLTSASGRYRLDGAPNALRFQLKGAVQSEVAQRLHLDIEVDGEASAAAPFPFDAQTSFEGRLAGDIPLAGRTRIQGDLRELRLDGSLERPLSLQTRGTIGLAPSLAEVDLSGEWQRLRWPLTGEAALESPRGKFRLRGPMDRPALELEADAAGPGLPPVKGRVRARLDASGAQVQRLTLNVLGGEIRAAGEAGWQPAPHWDLQVTGSRLEPERYFDGWPGEISFQTRMTGRVDAGTLELGFERVKLDGQLHGHPVAASGAVSVAGSTLTARELEIRSGNNRLQLHGEAGERLDIAFTVEAPVLSAVAPAVGGSLEGQGRLEGTRAQPRLSAKASGHDLRWDENRVDSVTLEVDAGAAPGYRSRVDVNASGIRAGGQSVKNVSLSGSGTPEAHRLFLALAAPAGALTAEAAGRYQDGDWSGSIESAIRSKDFGDWRTPEPAAVTAGPARLRLERFCLVQAPARVCAAARWQANDGTLDATGEVEALPLALAQPFLPAGLRVEGAVDAQFKAGGTLDRPDASARVVAPAGTFYYEPGTGLQGAEFDYRDARLEAAYSAQRTRLQMALELDNAGSMRGSVEMGAGDSGGARPLRGRIEAEFAETGWIGVMMPRLVDVRGRLDAALDIGGTTARPTFSGTLDLEDGGADVPEFGLELRRVNLGLRGDQSGRMALRGELRSGEGRLEIHGESEILPGGEWRLDLGIEGENFEVAKLPTVHAYASPDLRLKADPNLAELTGRVHIPRARVKLKELPQSATRVSDDEIIVNAEQTQNPAAKNRGPSVRLRVDVSLGDEVRFDGFGISTRIDGGLAVSGETDRPPEARGTLSLREGRYEAYGQALKIQAGRLLFTGPIDNPGVDLTAVREIDDITVGIAVSGSVKSVSSRVFSDPAMAEAEAFSYLLTGKPLTSGTQTDAAKLQQAAAALGLKRAETITQQIGETLGLDELSVGGDGMAQPSLLLGKRITPKLVIRYALGVFEQSGKLLLDYRLSDNVSVQAESGEQQGMDVIYKIEREKLF